MNRQVVILTAILTLPVAAQHAIDCGAEGMRSCNWKDWETYNMSYWTKKSCDADLKEVNGVCVDDKRRQLGKPYTWTNWAIKQQLQAIGAREPVNYLQWPGAHNAYSNKAQGFTDFFYQNQNYSLTDLLNYGIRHLELDPHYYGASGRFDVRLCHGSTTGYCLLLGWETRLFASALIEINDWLAANPDEILLIKLDDKLGDYNAGSDGFTPLQNLIATHIGSRVLKYSITNYQPANWPTPAEFKAFGKQVLISIHNSGPHKSEWVWDAKGRVLASNRPADQDYTTCTDSAGKTPLTRYILDWWDTAEGRSGSNVLSPNLFSTNTGLYQPKDVVFTTGVDRSVGDAVRCGVSIVGMDFVQALDVPQFVSTSAADTRLTEMVWSWKDNDYGLNGPAMFEKSSGRWVSKPQTESHPYACALKRPSVSSSQARQWKLTPESRTYSPIVGKQLCEQYFGSDYEFAYPTNGFQQGELIKAVSTDAWLNYSVAPVSSLSVNPGNVNVTMLKGAVPPAAATISLTSVSGMSITVDSAPALPTWLSVALPSTPFVVGASGLGTAQLNITAAASSLAPGHYFFPVNVRGAYPGFPDSVATINVHLNLRVNSSVTLSGPASVPWNSTHQLTGKVSVPGFANPEGQLNLLEGKAMEGGGYSTQIVQTGYLNSGNVQGGNFSFNVISQVAPGEHVYSVYFDGSGVSGSSNASESDPVFVTVRPRESTPASILFTMPKGGPLPTYQNLLMPGLTLPNAYYTSGQCNWLLVDLAAGGAKLNVAGAATTLAAGEYVCNLQFKDAQTGVGGYFEVPATLRVTTTLSATPTEINLVAAVNGPSVSGTFSVLAGGDASIPVAFSSDQAWLQASRVQESPNTPVPAAAVSAAPGNQTGSRSGFITITSPVSQNPATVRVNLQVVQGTVISTNPPGMTVKVDGVAYDKPATFAWAAGTQHAIEAMPPLGASPDTRQVISNWSNGVNTASFPYTAGIQGGNLVANYSPQYLLSASAVPTGGGSVTVQPASGDGFYAANAQVSLTAVPASGWELIGWSGSLTGATATGSVTMSEPRSVTAAFRQVTGVDLNIVSATKGILASVTVNGVSYALPATVKVSPGSTVSVAAQNPFVLPDAVTRTVFASWSNGNPQVHTFVMPSAALNLSLAYKTQYLVTLAASPLIGGKVSGAGWYDSGATASIQATSNSGYLFTNFRGGLTGTQNPQAVTVTAPVNAVANFGPSGKPVLVATTGPGRDSASPGVRTVPLNIMNLSSSSAAVDVRIVGVTDISTASGTGIVTLASPMPQLLGAINPNGSATQAVDFNWPLTATRARFTVRFVANGGTYSGSTTLTIYR